MSADRCNEKVFRDGKGICVFHAGSKVTEAWVRSVAKASGQRVDWHYSGGMANVLYLGDYEKVRGAVEELLPKLHAASKNDSGYEAWLFRILPPEAHGLYRQGDEVDEGTIAVDSVAVAAALPDGRAATHSRGRTP
jgi:hypothetical protein